MTRNVKKRNKLAAGGAFFMLDDDMECRKRNFTDYFVRTSTYLSLGCRLLWEKDT
jgi:hypothetical protein